MKLPLPDEKFICLDPLRRDLHGKVMENIHIEVYGDEAGIGFYCYGTVLKDYAGTCFGFSRTLEGAAEVINALAPYDEELFSSQE